MSASVQTIAPGRIRSRRLLGVSGHLQPVANPTEEAAITEIQGPTAQQAAVSHPNLPNMPDLSGDLAELWKTNSEVNRLTSIVKKQKAALAERMIAVELKEVTALVVMPNGARVPVRGAIEEASEDFVSVAKLKGLVDADTFMRIITATKGKVEEIAGQNVYLAAKETRTKPAAFAMAAVK